MKYLGNSSGPLGIPPNTRWLNNSPLLVVTADQ